MELPSGDDAVERCLTATVVLGIGRDIAGGVHCDASRIVERFTDDEEIIHNGQWWVQVRE